MKPYPNEELDRMSKREIIRLYKRTVEQFNDAVPVRHGKWENSRPDAPMFGFYYCSLCGRKRTSPQDRYCPNCGARMDG